jgi:hypothetical protein
MVGRNFKEEAMLPLYGCVLIVGDVPDPLRNDIAATVVQLHGRNTCGVVAQSVSWEGASLTIAGNRTVELICMADQTGADVDVMNSRWFAIVRALRAGKQQPVIVMQPELFDMSETCELCGLRVSADVRTALSERWRN